MSARHRESIVPVPVKTVEQQTICALHRVRAALMKTRTARLNTVRGLLREFGVTIAEGAERVLPAVREALSESHSPVPEPLHAALFSMMAEAGELDERSLSQPATPVADADVSTRALIPVLSSPKLPST